MDNQRYNINLKSKNKKEFFLIHGYSGSPTDFADLPNKLHKKFNANVKCEVLPGHCTTIKDLNRFELKDFIISVEKSLKKEIDSGKKIILIGISFGAQIALYLATKYKLEGLILCSITHLIKFPFNLPGFRHISLFKKYFKKNYHPNELELRKKARYYDSIPSKSLSLSRQLRKIADKNLKKVNAPILFIHSKKEPLGNYRSINYIFKRINSKIRGSYLANVKNHNLFYSEDRNKVISKILDFIKNNDLFNEQRKISEKATAIVPAYNEAKRISAVLDVLNKVDLIDEIIVVDDGSNDDTKNVVMRYKNVRYFKNKINQGKGYSLDLGVKKAKNDVLFFCDADLINFRKEHAREIILPVLRNKVVMFIGIRGNFMQKSIKAWALNSGERSLRKDIWDNLPRFYKYRYRIEAGLNHYVKKYSGGLDSKVFDYSQPLKEKKYGFIKGTFLRWWMNLDVLISTLSYGFISYIEDKNTAQ